MNYPELVDVFEQRMLEDRWNFEEIDQPVVYWQEGSTIYIAEGHHRINAALEIGKRTGNWTYLEKLIQHGRRQPGLPPQRNIGHFPTRTWWSRWLERLGF